MKEQLLKAWETNNRHNLALIKAISATGMKCTMSKRGGRTVALQLAHVHNVRISWLELSAKDLWKETSPLDKNEDATQKMLADAFTSSGKAIAKLLERSWDNNGAIKNFKSGLLPFLSYLISHEAHHRGNILLTLKLCDEKIPVKVKWGLWEW